MIDGVEYSKVIEVNEKADNLGFIIVPPFFKQSLIEPVKKTKELDLFQVKISELRYPTIQNVIVHEGNFNSVEVFIDGAYILYSSLVNLGVCSETEILTAAQHFILMNNLRNAGD